MVDFLLKSDEIMPPRGVGFNPSTNHQLSSPMHALEGDKCMYFVLGTPSRGDPTSLLRLWFDSAVQVSGDGQEILIWIGHAASLG